MNKKYITIVIIVILVAFGGYFVLQNNSETESVDQETTEEELGNDGSLIMKVPYNEDGVFDGNSDVEEMIVIDEQTTPPQKEPAQQLVVTYVSSGFDPKSITIEKGQTVVWFNENNRDMWVASAFHPTHSSYPEKTENDCIGSTFDACERIPSGQSWNFTFNNAGTWKYHNHLNPSQTGEIVVK